MREAPLAFLDFETTGLSALKGDRVCEVAVIRTRLVDAEVEVRLDSLVDPGIAMPTVARAIHHISDSELVGAPTFGELLPSLRDALAGAVFIAHNARFDLSFLANEAALLGEVPVAHGPVLCTLKMARSLYGFHRCGLAALALRTDVSQPLAHRSLADVQTTLGVFRALMDGLGEHEPATVAELLARVEGLRRGGAMRRQIVDTLRRAVVSDTAVTIDYTASQSEGALTTRRTITPHRVRLPHVEATCHLRGEARSFHIKRIQRIVEPTA